jgi:hypothetical protein
MFCYLDISKRDWNTPQLRENISAECGDCLERSHEIFSAITITQFNDLVKHWPLRQIARDPADVLNIAFNHILLRSQETSKGKRYERIVNLFGKACRHSSSLVTKAEVKKYPYLKGSDVCMVLHDDLNRQQYVSLLMTSQKKTKNDAGKTQEQLIRARFEETGRSVTVYKLVWEATKPDTKYTIGTEFAEAISGDPYAWDLIMQICKSTTLKKTNDEMIQEKIVEFLDHGWDFPSPSADVVSFRKPELPAFLFCD